MSSGSASVALQIAAGALGGAAIYAFIQSKLEQQDDVNMYETDKLVNEYLVFNYGSAREQLAYDFGPKDALDFPKRLAEICQTAEKGTSRLSRALDIGCAVGRTCFELARDYEEVVGLDFSHHFVRVCQQLKDTGRRAYRIQEEGDLYTDCEAVIAPQIERKRCTFRQADACNLPADLGKFGVVLAANLICRLKDPRAFLKRVPDLVVPSGFFILTSPYTFMKEFTPKEKWLGGYYGPGNRKINAFDTLVTLLGQHFDLVEEKNIPFFIRETAHKNQWSVAHVTIWRRRD